MNMPGVPFLTPDQFYNRFFRIDRRGFRQIQRHHDDGSWIVRDPLVDRHGKYMMMRICRDVFDADHVPRPWQPRTLVGWRVTVKNIACQIFGGGEGFAGHVVQPSREFERVWARAFWENHGLSPEEAEVAATLEYPETP